MAAGLRSGAALLAIAINLGACSETFRGPDPIISSEGVAPTDASSGGLVRLFFNSANTSYSSPADPTLARQMLSDGFALIYADCNEYFGVAGRTQQKLIFGRDLLGTFGTLVTGIIALAHASKDATAIAALVTATGYSVTDDISKDFLFAADNIDSIRELTLRAIQADQASVLAHNPVFNYNTVVLYIEDDQNYCTLRKIAELVKEAAKNAPVGEAAAAPPANLTGGIAPRALLGAAPAPPGPPPPAPPPVAAFAVPPASAAQTTATFQHIPIRVKPLDSR